MLDTSIRSSTPTSSAIGPETHPANSPGERSFARAPEARLLYAQTALASIPRLLGAIDRNPYRSTYGCLDRQFWHYRTSPFPSEMYQEGVLPLALVHAHPLPGNRWYGDGRVRQLVVAALRFSARASHRDGSCDDYYPWERALGAAVFSLAAGTEAYRLLHLDDVELLASFDRRARWLMAHDETGRLANHQALAALALLRVARLTGTTKFERVAEERVRRVLSWQSSEGWYDEYGGADPGYQTVTIDALAKYRRLTDAPGLDQSLHKAVDFAGWFLHPDHSYGGEYGSRGTYHFYPHGCELLAGSVAAAADLADGFLASLRDGTAASFDDDRMFVHRLGNLIEAYADWSPQRPPAAPDAQTAQRRFFGSAGILVCKSPRCHTVVSAARGGVFKHFAAQSRPVTDAGLIVEFSNGRTAVSQTHDLSRVRDYCDQRDGATSATNESLTVSGQLHYVRHETATPLKQALFHGAMLVVGRFCRGVIRRLLQRRLITGRRRCGMRLTRTVEFIEVDQENIGPASCPKTLRVTDRVEIEDSRLQVRRMSFGTDHQAAYVAAAGVYQESVRQPWTDLAEYVGELNTRRQVTIVREF